MATSTPKIEPLSLDILRVIRVYDGDTFFVDLACNQPVFCDNMRIRVRGVDTPEMRGGTAITKEAALKAKVFTETFLSGAIPVLENIGRDKYFRLLASVKVKRRDLATELIAWGLGLPYKPH